MAQDRVFAEHYLRRVDGSWRLTDHSDKSQTILLPSLNCSLTLAEVYEKVELSPPATGPPT